MDDRLTIEMSRLTAKIRETRASEVSFLAAIHENLRVAHVHRDWQLIRDTMQVLDSLTDDLASIGAQVP